MTVEAWWRPGPCHLAFAFGIHALVGFVILWTFGIEWLSMLLLVLVFASAVAELTRFARLRPVALRLVGERLLVAGVEVAVRSAWLGPGWLVLRGQRADRSFRIAIHRSDLDAIDNSRLRRYAAQALPRVNRPLVAMRRAGDR